MSARDVGTAGSRKVEEQLEQEDPQLSRGGRKIDVHGLGIKAGCLGACAGGLFYFCLLHFTENVGSLKSISQFCHKVGLFLFPAESYTREGKKQP